MPELNETILSERLQHTWVRNTQHCAPMEVNGVRHATRDRLGCE